MAISLDRARDFISSALKDDPTIFDGLDCHDQFDEIAQELEIDKTIVVEAYNQITLPPTKDAEKLQLLACLLYTSPSPRHQRGSRMPSSA